MIVRLGHSKGNECEENPRDIRREKVDHYREVASFTARTASIAGIVGTATIGALIAIGLFIFVVGGIVFHLLSSV
ncbi:hypothetical protein SEA_SPARKLEGODDESS_268 [Streptomyces phage SparkleGoddess]|uniref:Uncharacterized protein n=1 Tax=Streptomyces phage SparkleGoddess TaxID=2283305 RepID=A0A345MEG6_9CAUD|nr:hypothetical protein SEA_SPARKLEGODDESS_2 [Streptomyces phage SparkleGoddess]AXH68947.1 hypothetical protein SEA_SPARKLEGODDESS_268 [Streptomyces phage SparkleGoddess]